MNSILVYVPFELEVPFPALEEADSNVQKKINYWLCPEAGVIYLIDNLFAEERKEADTLSD